MCYNISFHNNIVIINKRDKTLKNVLIKLNYLSSFPSSAHGRNIPVLQGPHYSTGIIQNDIHGLIAAAIGALSMLTSEPTAKSNVKRTRMFVLWLSRHFIHSFQTYYKFCEQVTQAATIDNFQDFPNGHFKSCIGFLVFLVVICSCSFRICFQVKLSIKTVCTKVFIMFLNGYNPSIISNAAQIIITFYFLLHRATFKPFEKFPYCQFKLLKSVEIESWALTRLRIACSFCRSKCCLFFVQVVPV